MISHVCFIALTLAGPLDDLWTHDLTASCSNSFLGTQQTLMHEKTCDPYIIQASLLQNLFSVFLTRWISNQFPQLQRLARKLKLRLYICSTSRSNKQIMKVLIRLRICFLHALKDRFSRVEAQLHVLYVSRADIVWRSIARYVTWLPWQQRYRLCSLGPYCKLVCVLWS